MRLPFSAKVVETYPIVFERAKPKMPSSFSVWESKGIITKSTFDFITQPKDGQMVVPHVDSNWKLYRDIYYQVPVAKSAVDHTTNFAIQAGFELEGSDAEKEKVMQWIDEVNFNIILANVMKQMMIFGNAYLEFDGMKVLPADQMYVVVSKEDGNNGELIGYKQVFDLAYNKPIEFSSEEVIHFKWNEIGNNFYGLSDFKAASSTIRRLIQFYDDIGEIVHRYGNPILHHKLGTEEKIATTQQVADYKAMVDVREVGEDLITSSAVEVTPVISNLRMVQPDGLLKRLENQLIAGLQVPEIFVRGGESSNKATADVELQAFDRKVKALRTIVGTIVEDFIFKAKLGVDVKFSWHELSVESEAMKAEMMKNLVLAQVPTRTALNMVGWGSWVDDFDADKKEEDARQDELMAKQAKNQLSQPAQKQPINKGQK